MKIFLACIIVYFLGVASYGLFGNREMVLSEQEQYNKFYAEQRIETEMKLLASWQTIEDMTEEEYAEFTCA